MSLELPARRPLPPEVRERMRRTVVRRGGARTPVAAAAAVVLLAAGVAIVAQSMQDHDGVSVGGPPTATSTSAAAAFRVGPPTAADLERCGVDRAEATVEVKGRRIVLGDSPCELTGTTRSVRKPDAPTPRLADGITLLWVSPTGVAIGTAPRDVVEVTASRGRVTLADDVWVTDPDIDTIGLTFIRQDGGHTAVDLDRNFHRGWSTTAESFARPGLSDERKVVERCVDRAVLDGAPWVGDLDRWTLATKGARVTIVRTADGTLLGCSDYPGAFPYGRVTPQDERPFRHLGAEKGTTPLRVGGMTREDVAALSYTDPSGNTRQAVVRDGVFEVDVDDSAGTPTVRATDKSGAVIYEGPAY
ncbi:hypothetical protein GCM10022243_45010 [Saccharothrix violaceirubra]|uniref:Uncharacterized protein n=1 Tax=Saccharothrix violaceirubra TaxID=413306 RepID=A0A7W7WUS4_9PSEU|nr:hypothetical protein [Saccharothrix violaceirubra]MBB4964610.1 hypothetical protein [Saccharothrix violaceirubra]